MTKDELIKKYPWLELRNVWTNEKVKDTESTWLDDLPEGWKIAFGEQMIEELDEILRKANFQNDYRITQIKEKYGSLRWYDDGVPLGILEEQNEWLAKYEDLSEKTCMICGKPR